MCNTYFTLQLNNKNIVLARSMLPRYTWCMLPKDTSYEVASYEAYYVGSRITCSVHLLKALLF